MFWRTQAPAAESDIDQLLNKPNQQDVKLTELMDSEYLLQEVKVSNKKLIAFLIKPEIIKELMDLSLKEPPGDPSDKLKYKYSNLSCEVITADEDTLINTLVESEEVQQAMLDFLRNQDALNPLLASFYARIYSVLVAKQPQKMLSRFMSELEYLDCLLNHTSTPSIMNLLFFMITSVNDEEYREKLKLFLCERHVVRRLIKLLSPNEGEESNSNAPYILCELIRQLRELVYCKEDRSPDPLLNQIQSEDSINELLNVILNDHPTELSVIGGIQVILALLQPFVPTVNLDPQTQFGSSQTSDGLPSQQRWTADPDRAIERVILSRLGDFHRLLLNPPHAEPIDLTSGRLEVPLGQTRLFIVKLVSTLLETGNLALHNEVMRLGIMEEIFRLFKVYEGNSFLHSACEQCVSILFDGISQEGDVVESKKFSPLLEHVVRYCHLPEFILRGLHLLPQSSDSLLADKEHVIVKRIPFAGHLYKMTNELVTHRKEEDKSGVIDQIIKELPSDLLVVWEKLEKEWLPVYLLQNKPDLDSIKSDTSMLSIDKDSADFPPLGSLQQAAQIQSLMPTDLPDRFTAGQEEFSKDPVAADFLKSCPQDLVKLDLDALVSNIKDSEGEQTFDAICNQNISSLGDFVDEWPEEEFKPARSSVSVAPPKRKSSRSSSSDSSDEETTIKAQSDKMEMDSETFAPAEDVDFGNFGKDSDNWANFDNFESANPLMDTSSLSKPNTLVESSPSVSSSVDSKVTDRSTAYKMDQ